MIRHALTALVAGAGLVIAPAIWAQTAQAGSQSGNMTATAGGTHQWGHDYGLSKTDVKELQTALNNTGCNAGTPDGIIGHKTDAAMACAAQKKNVTNNDANQLFRALNLNFTTRDSTALGRVMTTSGGEVAPSASPSPGAMQNPSARSPSHPIRPTPTNPNQPAPTNPNQPAATNPNPSQH